MTQEQAYKTVNMLLTAYAAQRAVRDIPKETVELYACFLRSIPLNTGQAAIMKIIANNEFFPTIAEIKKAVMNLAPLADEPPSAEQAWDEVRKQLDIYRAPTWSHPAIAKTVETMGFRNLVDSLNPGRDMERFMKIYETYRQRDIDQIENAAIRRLTTDIMQQLPGGGL